MKFSMNRPHSSYDHRRTCAVIGCKSKEYQGGLCRSHAADGQVVNDYRHAVDAFLGQRK